MVNTLIHHVRSRNKKKLIGTIVATKIAEDKVVVSWSKCNYKDGDKYNKQEGVKIASNRAVFGTNKKVPASISSCFEKMMQRATKYFKDIKVSCVYPRVNL